MARVRATDIIGKRFGRLLAVTVVGKDKHGRTLVSCECLCGNIVEVCCSPLAAGRTRSCGCLQKEAAVNMGRSSRTHGMSRSPEYEAWKSMLKRCTNLRYVRYPDYGGRGITVCDCWLKFENFYKDMGPRPSPDHSLERKDNDGGYCKENCIWATRKEQQNNLRSNVRLSYNGETRTLVQWAAIFSITPDTLRHRLDRLNWSIEKALTTPVRSLHAR